MDSRAQKPDKASQQLKGLDEAGEASTWKPDHDQMRFALATVQLGIDSSVLDRARLARVAVRVARRWLKDINYKRWLLAAVDYVKTDRVAAMWDAVYRRGVTAGDMRAAELFLRRFDPDAFAAMESADVREKNRERRAIDDVRAMFDVPDKDRVLGPAEFLEEGAAEGDE